MTKAAQTRFMVIPGLILLIVVLNVRVVWSAGENLDTARGCAAIGLVDTAIDFYARAARWYTPFSSAPQDAIEGLLDVARGSEARQDPKTALKALREARAAILATRWLFTPSRERLPDINERIADLMAASAATGAATSNAADNLAQLRRTNLPDPWLSLMATLMFAAWIPVTVIGASRAVTAEGRFAGRTGLAWIAASAGLLACWLILVAIA